MLLSVLDMLELELTYVRSMKSISHFVFVKIHVTPNPATRDSLKFLIELVDLNYLTSGQRKNCVLMVSIFRHHYLSNL